MKNFIHIRSDKFPVLPGEEDELVNEGMYGKALSQYLQEKLKEIGYDAPFYCCEDWGWWIELKGFPCTIGVCIYSGPQKESKMDYACCGEATSSSVWSWQRFRFVETRTYSEKLLTDLTSIFDRDKDIEIVALSDDYPF